MADKPRVWIEVEADGPYIVHGPIPLVRKVQVVSEHGEPLTWRKDVMIPTGESYDLCRCGESSEWPICDGTHRENFFDGTETAETNIVAERRFEVEGGTRIAVFRDDALCMEAGFCGNRFKNVFALTPETGESTVRGQVMAMIERCPSGAFMYRLRDFDGSLGTVDIEPDLPQQIAVTVEVADKREIRGPLWVTGNIPIVRSDGQPFETRNRVTLCNCGKSQNKPLCDGTHRHEPVYLEE
jgi:CDGSH-type Zn-finger protein